MTDQSTDHLALPEPPPSIDGVFIPTGRAIARDLHRSIWAAVGMYSDACRRNGRPYPGWEPFERALATQFAFLLLFLKALPREDPRRKLLGLFLDTLNLENKPGRARKAKEEMKALDHGHRMVQLWAAEIEPAWNMKKSLERAGAEVRKRLENTFKRDVVDAICASKATPRSAVAKLYSLRSHVSKGRARNALREYLKFEGNKKLAARL
jgi:hypothetical protein